MGNAATKIRPARLPERSDGLQSVRGAARDVLRATTVPSGADAPDLAPGLTEGRAADLTSRAASVAAVAARHAAAIDAESRFPREAMAAARGERLLGIAIPRELGGEGAGIGEVAEVCYALGRACASTAMTYAMHQTKVACLVRHGRTSPWHQRAMRRIAGEQLLLASSTTEGQAGGDLRNSAAPIEQHGSRITLDRQATVISYGEAADGLVTTARRAPDAATNDQVLVVFLKDDYTLEWLNGWDAFGMRGTCSSGYRLRASGLREQILPVGYETIHTQTMMPYAHLTWSAAWAGIAAAAVERARAYVRHAAHRSGGALPPGAAHLTRASATLRTLRSLMAAAIARFEAASADPAVLASVDFQTAMTMHKVNASELAVSCVLSAMQTCGLAGYRNDGAFSIGRHLRDVLSSPIMISNDRILANLAAATLLGGTPASLRD